MNHGYRTGANALRIFKEFEELDGIVISPRLMLMECSGMDASANDERLWAYV